MGKKYIQVFEASENNLFTQVYGKKNWYLYPPEYDIIFNPPVTRSPYFYTNFNPDIPDFEIYLTQNI